MKKRKHSTPSPDLMFILIGILTVFIVAIPITQWVLVALVADVAVFLYAVNRARHTL